MHSLEIVQWDSTRRDHPGYPGRVSGSGPVSYILHSKRFPTTPHTPKSELKRRSYGLDKLDKVFCRTIENYITTWFSATTEKLCRDIENYALT